jgi:predicted permease
LPAQDPGRIVNLRTTSDQHPFDFYSCDRAGNCDEVFSYPMFRDLETAHTALAGLAGHVLTSVNIGLPGQTPINADGVFVTGSYFPVLGLEAARGRLIGPGDDETIPGQPVAVLGYAFWESQLASNPAVVGQPIMVNGQRLTIIGVTPRGFDGTTMGARPYVYLPMTMRGVVANQAASFTERRDHWMYVFGRLKPGATIEEATASLNIVFTRLINDVEAPQHSGASEREMAKFRADKISLADGSRGQSSIRATTKTPLIMLFAVAAIVLLIACANIANLLLSRAADRQMEMAVRLSLGATSGQLIGQLLTESLLLAGLGGVASIYVAHLTLNGILAMLPPDGLGTMDFSLSAPAMIFAAGLSLTTGVLFGLAPAIQSTRPDLVAELRNSSGKLSASRGAARFRNSLVTVQIALSMMLLIAAGLFVKSLRNVSRVDLGINIDNVVTFAIAPGLNGYDAPRRTTLYDRVDQELAGIPGVTGVTSSAVALLTGHNRSRNVTVEGFRADPGADAGSSYAPVGAKYYTVLGVPLLAGRDIDAQDDAAGRKVAIVNETFARKFNLGANPVGKHLSIANYAENIEIVGFARDAKYSQVKQVTPPVVVIPYQQFGSPGTLYFYVRGTLPTGQILRATREVMRRIDPTLPIVNLKTMPQQVRENVFLDRMISAMSAAFAILATLLAAIGLYGVLAYSVARRTREIGVRMALGADSRGVRAMVLRQVGLMTLIGGTIGVAAAVALGRAAKSLLFELDGTDPMVFGLAALSLTLVALAAGFLPALRASRVDPIEALRDA